MAVDTLEERVQRLENKIQAVEDQLTEQARHGTTGKRGWRWFVGIYADSPDFEEVVRVGREWRKADQSPVISRGLPGLKVEDWSA